MARKTKAEVEISVQDPLADRVLSQEITYLAQPGRRITQSKIDYMDKVQRTMTGLVAEGVGLEVIDVRSRRD